MTLVGFGAADVELLGMKVCLRSQGIVSRSRRKRCKSDASRENAILCELFDREALAS